MQKALRTSLKAAFLRTKTSFARVFLRYSQKIPIFTNQKSFFYTNPSLIAIQSNSFPPSASHSHHPLTYCLQRMQPFFCCSLNSLRCKAGASHRFKSLPAIPGEVAAFRKTGYLMITGHFRKNTVSTGDLNRPRSPEVRKPLVCFLVLFAQRKKHEKRSFPGSSEVLQTSNQHTTTAASHRNN